MTSLLSGHGRHDQKHFNGRKFHQKFCLITKFQPTPVTTTLFPQSVSVPTSTVRRANSKRLDQRTVIHDPDRARAHRARGTQFTRVLQLQSNSKTQINKLYYTRMRYQHYAIIAWMWNLTVVEPHYNQHQRSGRDATMMAHYGPGGSSIHSVKWFIIFWLACDLPRLRLLPRPGRSNKRTDGIQ